MNFQSEVKMSVEIKLKFWAKGRRLREQQVTASGWRCHQDRESVKEGGRAYIRELIGGVLEVRET